MKYEALRLERDDHTAVLTLCRPDVMNALDRRLTSELHGALVEVGNLFPEVRALILTGEGRGFCSGADLAEMGLSLSGDGARRPVVDRSLRIQGLASRIRGLPQPVIAAVNGAAVGAGLSLALASDIRIASEAARFSCIFVRRSLVPDTAASYTLAALAGQGVANEMALTGRIYNAEWALGAGLVSRVVAPEDLMEEARSFARDVAVNPPLAVRETKRLMWRHSPSWEEVVALEDEAAAPLSGTEDQRESVRAFLESRGPVFRGR